AGHCIRFPSYDSHELPHNSVPPTSLADFLSAGRPTTVNCPRIHSPSGASKQQVRLSSVMICRFLVAVVPLLLAPAAGAAERAAFELEECPPCEDLFLKLEAGADGRLSQSIEMQERGEPKSGTGMMGIWARA
ncbi:unnamed protein product, partial [Scytosiphon promiscuus]